MRSQSPLPNGSGSVTLADSKAKAVPFLGAIWVAVVLLGAFFLVSGAFLGAVLFLALAGGFAFWVVPNALAFFKWHPAEVVIPADAFALGAIETVIYRRRPRKISDIAESEIKLTLECIETARYQVGTDTRTEVSTVAQQTFIGTGGGTLNGFEAPIPIQVPSNAGGPTLHLSNNKIEWKMRIQVNSSSKLPNQEITFPLVVGPVLAKPEIQDAPPPSGNQTPQDGVGGW